LIKCCLGALISLLLMAMPAQARNQAVDLELAFVVDASGSIDDDETRLQRQGYADALAHPKVQKAIGSGFLRSVAVSYIEFAADGCATLSVDWMRIANPADARAFGAKILARERMFCPGGNAIGEAIAFATASIESNKFEGTRRVIDVSGDGPNTVGPEVEPARDAAVALRITVNGLVIHRPMMPNLDQYYRQSVIGGPGSFAIKADRQKNFAEAILKKIILEIADNDTDGGHGILKRTRTGETGHGIRILHAQR
jgi:hypothetical protein